VPAVEIEPEWILAGVLPPLLYATSVSMPTMDFRRDLNAISGLSVILVVFTSVGLGVLLSWLIPDVGLATGIALGAILSPTDAVATSIVRRSGVSPRLVTVLEGESLLNDASALVLLRSAIAATAASVSLWQVAGDFVFAVVVAVAIGAVVGKASLLVRSRLRDAHLTTAVSFIVPFVAYLPTEHLGASGLVATVAAGLVAGSGSARLRPQDRIAEAANWRTLELLLEGAVFLVMGLELYGLVVEVQDEGGSLLLAVGLAALSALVVLAVRTGYVAFLLTTLHRRARRGLTARGYLTAIGQRADDLASLTREDMAALRLPGRPPSADRVLATEAAGAARGAVDGITGAEVAADVERRAEVVASAAVPDATVPDATVPGTVLPGEGAVRDPGARGASRAGRGGRPPGDPTTRMQQLRARITRRVADIDYLQAEAMGPREGAVLVWAGMRGVVTLAAAQSLPADTPQRALLVLIAFLVAAGTLLVQGGTLGWLVRRLGLGRDPHDAHEEIDRLTAQLASVAVQAMLSDDLRRPDGEPYDPQVLARVRKVTEQRSREQAEQDGQPGVPEQQVDPASLQAQFLDLRLAMLDAQRAELLRVRGLGTASSAALTSVLAALDADQISLEMRARP
jgi:CPA1 family monovalent cation:H+ antiporter